MIAARIPVANMAAANASLEAQGFGPNNFRKPAYTGVAPQFAVLHAWGTNLGPFYAAVKALPNVVWSEAAGGPQTRVEAALAGIQGKWSGSAQPLTGVVTPGLYVRGDEFWWVIQQYDTVIWPDPTAVPALVRRARVPGTVQPWVQPLDQFDAYKLSNPFTGQPDRALWYLPTDTAKTGPMVRWEVAPNGVDGAGNNVSEPGVFGWINLDAPQTQQWQEGVAYKVGDLRTFNGVTYRCIVAHTAFVGAGWNPPAVPSLWVVA